MTLDKAFKQFILSKRMKALADKSIQDYTEFISPFLTCAGHDTPLDMLSSDVVEDYILSLYDTPKAVATLATYIRNLKIFLRWIEKKYDINLSASEIEVPKPEKKLVHIYSDNEIMTIYRTVYAESDWLTFRNRAIIFLMLDSGLRQNEVCTLMRNDVDFDKNTIIVHGKGRKERLVYLGKHSSKILTKYLMTCPHKGSHMFLNRRGNPLTTDAVKHMMFRISQQLPFEFSSHKLRHNFATNFCIDQYRQYGHMDVYRLMSLMGHSDLRTTQRYMHHAMEILAASENSSHLDMIFDKII